MKNLTLLLLFTFSILNLHCQNLRGSIGLNTGNIGDSEIADFSPKLGYQFNIDIQFGNKVYFQAGLSYAMRSNKIDQQPASTSKLNMGSIKIPAMVGYHFNYEKDSKVNFYAYTGPSVHIITSIEHDESNESLTIGDDDLHDVEWTWTIAGGLEVKSFFLELAYEHGLTYTLLSYPVKRNLFFTQIGYKLAF